MTPSIMVWRKLLRILSSGLFWLALWQITANILERHLNGRGNQLLLPFPMTVFTTLLELSQQPDFWYTVASSLLRVTIGMAVGCLIGGLLAILTCAFSIADLLFSPIIRIIRATPVASFILLVLLWTERTTVPVVIATLMVIPVVWETLCRGIHATDAKLLELAYAYHFSLWKIVTIVYFPSLRPYLSAAVTTSMGLAWKSGIAAEILCLPKLGVGTEIYETKLYLEIPALFAWTAVVVCLSLFLEWLLRTLLRKQHKQGGNRCL